MTDFYAQPYDMTASGFYFETWEQYLERAGRVRNSAGGLVEEYEIQFIDGERIDAALANAWDLNQANIRRFMEVAEEWDDWQKRKFIIAVSECGHVFDPDRQDPDDFDVEIYPTESMRAFAEECIEDGWFGEIPEILANYIDYDAIARDLSVDYSETEVAGECLVYRCG